MTTPFRFGLHVSGTDLADLADRARRAEAAGFDTVVVPDHIGGDLDPFLVLLHLAGQTSTVRLGTMVLNASFHNPLLLARTVATLDRLTGGRVELGLGAGHTPAEFAAAGVPKLSGAERKSRVGEVVEVVRRLLDGETVDHAGEHIRLTGASTPPAQQQHLPILVGGSGPGLLSHAARHADAVQFTGLGRTLADGHRHEARMGSDALDRQVAVVRAAAGDAGTDPELSVFVQVVDVTDDRERAAAGLAERVEGLDSREALATPFLLLGSVGEIVEQLLDARDRWGISYVVVRQHGRFGEVIEAVRGR